MTLRDISELTGVSASTVSRILSGKHPKCASREVYDRVWEAAQQCGYKPNLTARQLKQGERSRQDRVLTVIFSRSRDDDSNQFFQELARSVNEEILRGGCPVGHTVALQEFLESGAAGETQGVVVLGRCSAEKLRSVSALAKNVVCVGLNPYDAAFDQVLCDGQVAAEMAMRYLLEQGHYRIGYVGECSSEIRYIGYRNCLMREKIPFDARLVYEAQQTETGGVRAAQRVLETPDPPTALFCANDATAAGVFHGIKALDPDAPVPALISIDNTNRAQESRLMLTTINIPIAQMGAMAVKLLLDRIDGGHTSPVRVEFPCNLVRRHSS